MKRINSISIHNQAGLSSFKLLFLIFSLGLIVLTVFKVAPMYLDFYQAQSIVNSVAEDQKVNIKSPKDFLSSINKSLRVNNIRSISSDDFNITRNVERKVTIVHIKYEVREDFFADTFIGASFDKKIEISR